MSAILALAHTAVTPILRLQLPAPVIFLCLLVCWILFAFSFPFSKFCGPAKTFEIERGVLLTHVSMAFFFLVRSSKDTEYGSFFDNETLGDITFYNFSQWHMVCKVFLVFLVLGVLGILVIHIAFTHHPGRIIRAYLALAVGGMVGTGGASLYCMLASGIIGGWGMLPAIAINCLGALVVATAPIAFLICLSPQFLIEERAKQRRQLEIERRQKRFQSTTSSKQNEASADASENMANVRTITCVRDEAGNLLHVETRGDYLYITTASGAEVSKRLEEIPRSYNYFSVGGKRYYIL
jgi:hypothetical protein